MSGRKPFKLDIKNKFLVILIYHRFYIACTLIDYFFNLDYSNVCRDIQKIEGLKKLLISATKII